jgi:hypothetical protein
MNKLLRVLLIGAVSVLSAQSTLTLKNSINGNMVVGDTITFTKPYLYSVIKSGDEKWFTTIFVTPPWNEDGLYIEELFFKPYNDKFTIQFGQQAIPFGSTIPYLDLTRFDPFTYQTSDKVGLILIGRGVSVYGDIGPLFVENYYGSHIEDNIQGYVSTRVSYGWKGQYIGASIDNQNRQALDVSGWSKYVDYAGEISLSHDYQWVRAMVKSGFYGVSFLTGYENFDDESKPLYGVMWVYGDRRFISAEFSGKGDITVKINCGLDLVTVGK